MAQIVENGKFKFGGAIFLMGEISIRFIGKENAADINIKNESIQLFGRMLPCYQNGKWSYSITENDKIEWDIFP